MADSDDDEGEIDATAYKKRQISRKRSPGTASTNKQRVAVPAVSDEGEEYSDAPKASFSRRLTKYKKSPAKKKAKRRLDDDDDDFTKV